jgi:hypothetical protein
MTVLRTAFAALMLCAAAAPAFAQQGPGLRPHHVDLGGGVVWSGGYDIGAATAALRGNAPGPSAPVFNWFSTASRVSGVAAPEFHVGVALTRVLAIDGVVSYARPRVAIAIRGDAEAPAQELPGEQIEQYQIGAGLTWQPLSLGRKAAPFVTGGGAYLRQLHEDRALAETGRIYYAGGGVRYWLRGGHGASTAAGVRVDARLNLRKNGIDIENAMRAFPSLTLSLFVGL